MYRLLIVDDERIARESVYGLLATQDDLELELLTADSAVRAVSILETERVDITIMDINMPQMTGLELYSVVREKWPQCKVIFLTGYSEFDYVYQVHTHARYVLKADREEVLLDAVRESIREIENELLIQRGTEIDSDYRRKAERQQANVFMCELIDGYISLKDVNNEVLRDMNVMLDYRKPVYTMMIRLEGITKESFQRGMVTYVKIYQMLEKYFGKGTDWSITYYRKTNVFLMLQPHDSMTEAAEVRRLASLCSLFQSALQANTEADAAIAILDRTLRFEEAIQSFDRIYEAMFSVSYGDTQIISLTKDEADGRNDLFQSMQRIEKLMEQVGADTIQEGLQDLPVRSEFHSWNDAFAQLEEMAAALVEQKEKARSEQEENLVTRIKRYIERHLQDGPSLTDIADHYHFSREYLLRVFKKEEGITILQYIKDLKLKKAEEALRGTDRPVKEIAETLGFSSTAYFIRFFRAKEGMSPQAWRDGKKG